MYFWELGFRRDSEAFFDVIILDRSVVVFDVFFENDKIFIDVFQHFFQVRLRKDSGLEVLEKEGIVVFQEHRV